MTTGGMCLATDSARSTGPCCSAAVAASRCRGQLPHPRFNGSNLGGGEEAAHHGAHGPVLSPVAEASTGGRAKRALLRMRRVAGASGTTDVKAFVGAKSSSAAHDVPDLGRLANDRVAHA